MDLFCAILRPQSNDDWPVFEFHRIEVIHCLQISWPSFLDGFFNLLLGPVHYLFYFHFFFFIPHFSFTEPMVTGAIALLGTSLTAYAYVWETIEMSEEAPPLQPETASQAASDEKRRARNKPIMSAGTGL